MKSSLARITKFIPGTENIFLQKFIQTLKQERVPLEIVDPRGKTYATAPGNIRHRLRIKDPKFFNALISPDAFSLGEAYVRGYFDVSGSLRDLYEMVRSKLLNTNQSQSFLAKNILDRVSQGFVKAREREKQNIEHHYDVPSEFYRGFLGQTMGYTCGYYGSEDATMSDAQNEKMEIICKKLRLQKGEHLLDIGCGWGNFAVYAAKNYHVRVKGITLSAEQKKYADQWIQREGLDNQIRIDIINYRDLGQEKFDKISCVGMSEHVGRDNMKRFYRSVFNCLEEDGLFLQHTITTNSRHKRGFKNSFLDTFMFPGGELMRQQDLIDLAAGSGFELLTAENFRVHYIKTLGDWIGRIEKNKAQLLKIVSEKIYRVYHVFFIGSLVSFRQKEIALFQNLFYKSKVPPNPSGAAWNYFLTPFSKIGPKIGPETGSMKGSKDETESSGHPEV